MKVSEELLVPERGVWSVRQLRGLAHRIGYEFGGELAGVARYDPDARWWTRLALTAGVEVWLLSWLPGQGTKPHDHGGAAGAFSVVRGQLTERYQYPGKQEQRGIRRQGETIAFGADRAHIVSNEADGPALSVHAYSPPLVGTREYGSLAEVRSTRVALPVQRGAVVLEVP